MTSALLSLQVKAYVLTIEENGSARREGIASDLNQTSLDWTFFEGIRVDDPRLLSLYSSTKNLIYSKRSLSAGEIACYASHRAIWRRISASDDRFAIVFEDDARIIDFPRLDQALADLSTTEFDLIKMFDFRPKKVVVSGRIGNTQVVSHKTIASSTACYVISRRAARNLLKRPTIFRAVDEDMSHPWEFDIDVWSVFPNPVIEADVAGSVSSIEAGRKDRRSGKLRRLYGEVLHARKSLLTRRYQDRLRRRYGE